MKSRTKRCFQQRELQTPSGNNSVLHTCYKAHFSTFSYALLRSSPLPAWGRVTARRFATQSRRRKFPERKKVLKESILTQPSPCACSAIGPAPHCTARRPGLRVGKVRTCAERPSPKQRTKSSTVVRFFWGGQADRKKKCARSVIKPSYLAEHSLSFDISTLRDSKQ